MRKSKREKHGKREIPERKGTENSLYKEMDKFNSLFPPDRQIHLLHQTTLWVWKYTLKHDSNPTIDLYDLVTYLDSLSANANCMMQDIQASIEDFYETYPVEMQYRYLYFLLTTVSKWQLHRGVIYEAEEVINLLDQLFFLAIIKSGIMPITD